MKRFPSPAKGLTLACSLSLPFALMNAVLADTLKLKDGTVLEGRATDVPPDSIKFEWRPSPSIKEEKIFKRTEIAELKRLAPDEAEMPALRKLIPTADLLGPTVYSKVIETQLKPFLTKFPNSKFADEVKGIQKTYEEELQKLNSGWQKLDGAWISPEEGNWNDYNIEARILRKEMQNEIKKNDTKAALDKMMQLKLDYMATPSFVEAIELYSKMLDEYDKDLLRQIQEFPARQKERADRKATLNKVEAEEQELAYTARLSDLKLKVEDEKKNNVPILSSDPDDLASIKASQASVAKERVSVQGLIREKDKYAEVAEMVSQAYAEAGKGNLQMASTKMELALKNPLLKANTKLKSKAAGYKTAAAELAKTAPKPVVNTADTKGDTPTVKEADKAAEIKKAEAKKAEAAKKAATIAAENLPEEEDNSSLYLLGGAGVLVLAGAGWALLKKRKKEEDE